MVTADDAGRQLEESPVLEIGLAEVINSVEDELLVVDHGYHIQFVNSAVMRQLADQSVLGRPCYEVIHSRSEPCCVPLWDCPLAKVMETGNPCSSTHQCGTMDTERGVNRYIKLTMYPLKDPDGRVLAAVCLRRDVTAERELETEMLTRHHQLLALSRISSAVSGLSHLDDTLNVALDTVLEIVNGTIGGILLLDERTQELTYRVQRGLSGKYAEEMRLKLGEGISGTVAQTGEPVLVLDMSRDPRTARLDLVRTEGLKSFVGVPLRAKNRVLGVMNIASHLPGEFAKEDMYLLDSIGHQLGVAIEQAELYERLSNATERYQTLLQHAMTAQEEERKRIARELHDSTSQMLTGLALNIQAAMDVAEMNGIHDPMMEERLKKAHSLAVETSLEVSKLINDLRPTLLDSLGLAPAIQRYIETWLQPKGINTSLKTRGHERLPSEVEVALFRIAQEAVNNITRHSEAKHVDIDLQCDGEKCVLKIRDDGKGFDVQEITKVDKTGRGVGLFGMQERVTLVGGTCSVDSTPGQGTTIVSEVPYTGSTDNADNTSAGGG
jgi:signal transduction histidine kinase